MRAEFSLEDGDEPAHDALREYFDSLLNTGANSKKVASGVVSEEADQDVIALRFFSFSGLEFCVESKHVQRVVDVENIDDCKIMISDAGVYYAAAVVDGHAFNVLSPESLIRGDVGDISINHHFVKKYKMIITDSLDYAVFCSEIKGDRRVNRSNVMWKPAGKSSFVSGILKDKSAVFCDLELLNSHAKKLIS